MTVSDAEKNLQYLVLKLGEKEYGVKIEIIDSIIEANYAITRVAGTDAFVLGVINLRGEIIPVIDPGLIISGNNSEITEQSRIVIISVDGTLVGLIVESVSEVITVDGIESLQEDYNTYVSGYGKKNDRIIAILNIDIFLMSNS